MQIYLSFKNDCLPPVICLLGSLVACSLTPLGMPGCMSSSLPRDMHSLAALSLMHHLHPSFYRRRCFPFVAIHSSTVIYSLAARSLTCSNVVTLLLLLLAARSLMHHLHLHPSFYRRRCFPFVAIHSSTVICSLAARSLTCSIVVTPLLLLLAARSLHHLSLTLPSMEGVEPASQGLKWLGKKNPFISSCVCLCV